MFDIMHKNGNDLFILVTDERLRTQMPGVTWMLFEESPKRRIYFTEAFTPIEGQPCIGKAREWFLKRDRDNNSEDKHETSKQRRNKKKKEKKKEKAAIKQGGSQQEESHESEGESEGGTLEEENSHLARKASSVGDTDSSSKGDGRDEDRREEAESSHVTVGDTDSSSKDAEGDEDEEAAGADTVRVDNANKGAEAEVKGAEEIQAVDYDGDFLEFLLKFEDDGCQYFKGIIEAFKTEHAPRFYVPFQFIMEFSEILALRIQDTHSRIHENLKKSVVRYLSINGLENAEVELRITDLPAPESVQLFLDYLSSITLHEHYDVYGGGSEALPSLESRRMALGYLHCIIAKFKTGKCWGGTWSAANLKVKNKGSDFVIECEEDYILDPDKGFVDLLRFTEVVLDCLKHNEQYPPYFDEFGDDILLISECWGNPVKWKRFLELISSPLALKPPLVRSSLICNIYLGGNANCTGHPPRYLPLVNRKKLLDWRAVARSDPLLRKVFDYQHPSKVVKWKQVIEIWSCSHWHVFKFSRHFIQHVLRHTKDNNQVQTIHDISVVDILLSRKMGKFIAQSVRFVVMNHGVDGLFSSSWRHIVGSEYCDKPCEYVDPEDEAEPSNMLQEFLNSISDDEEDEVPGCAFKGVGIPSQSYYNVSEVISNSTLEDIKSVLERNGLNCEDTDDGNLICESLKLWKRRTPEGISVIVVEGPFSVHYTNVFTSLCFL